MGMSMWTLFNAAMGTYDEDTYLSDDAPQGAIPFFLLYAFVIAIILFNLLITLLMDAYSQVGTNAFSYSGTGWYNHLQSAGYPVMDAYSRVGTKALSISALQVVTMSPGDSCTG